MMKHRYDEFFLRKCTIKDVDQIFDFQKEIISGLKDKEVLRENEKSKFEFCVQEPSLTVGLYREEELVAIGIFVVEQGIEDLSLDLVCHKVDVSANFKLIMVKEEYRGNGFQRALMHILEKYAYSLGFTHLCTTVSEKNIYSLHNVKEVGYEYDHSALKYGELSRGVFVKDIKSSISAYNKMIYETINSLEGRKEPNALIVEGINFDKCFPGELFLANTGDMLKYLDSDSGGIFYGLFIKKFTPMVLIYSSEKHCLELLDFSYHIGSLELQEIFLNTVGGR